ncbi:hypothetical protein [Christiangramia fulva]|nr:hypothetical protein [Christiangramia fulva]
MSKGKKVHSKSDKTKPSLNLKEKRAAKEAKRKDKGGSHGLFNTP